MKKLSKKLKLAKETLRRLEAESLENALGAATERTVCVTNCRTACTACRASDCATC
jgi:hypothetical protein